MTDRYLIYPDFSFGVVKFEPGEKSFADITGMLRAFMCDPRIGLVTHQLIDLKGCRFDFNISFMKEMTTLVGEYKNVDKRKIAVYLVDEPMVTALVHLFLKTLGTKRHYCSTLQKAYELLMMNMNYDKFLELVTF